MVRDTLIHALGRLAGAEAFVSDESRSVSALATVDAAWRAYRRDAGAGAVGVAHQPAGDAEALSVTADTRRDAVLLWLADHAAASIGAAAVTLARVVGAQHRFGSAELALLDTALEALEAPATDGPLARATGLADRSAEHPLQALRPAVTAIDALIADPRFAEAPGEAPLLTIAGRTVRGSWTGDPGGCWALNLALLTRPATGALAGAVPRSAFRRDCDADDRAAALVAQGAQAAVAAFERLWRIERRSARGRAALAGLSRNARAGEAWALVVALGPVRRVHVARALGLSRAGADLQAQALAAAGLATLAPAGWIHPVPPRPAAPPVALDHGPLEAAAADLDASMAAIDRLLARTRA